MSGWNQDFIPPYDMGKKNDYDTQYKEESPGLKNNNLSPPESMSGSAKTYLASHSPNAIPDTFQSMPALYQQYTDQYGRKMIPQNMLPKTPYPIPGTFPSVSSYPPMPSSYKDYPDQHGRHMNSQRMPTETPYMVPADEPGRYVIPGSSYSSSTPKPEPGLGYYQDTSLPYQQNGQTESPAESRDTLNYSVSSPQHDALPWMQYGQQQYYPTLTHSNAQLQAGNLSCISPQHFFEDWAHGSASSDTLVPLQQTGALPYTERNEYTAFHKAPKTKLQSSNNVGTAGSRDATSGNQSKASASQKPKGETLKKEGWPPDYQTHASRSASTKCDACNGYLEEVTEDGTLQLVERSQCKWFQTQRGDRSDCKLCAAKGIECSRRGEKVPDIIKKRFKEGQEKADQLSREL